MHWVIGYSYSECLPLRWISVHRRRDTSPLLLPQSARKISRKFTCRRALAVQTSVHNLKSTGAATARQRAREYARVRASTRGRSKSSTELANLGSNSPTFCTKTTAQRIQSGFSMERTEETVKILTALLVRTTRIVLDEIRKLFIIGYLLDQCCTCTRSTSTRHIHYLRSILIPSYESTKVRKYESTFEGTRTVQLQYV